MTRLGRWQHGLLGVAALVLLGFVGLVVAALRDDPGPPATLTPESSASVVRPDSHVLGDPGRGGVELVEFLDFECEGCAAAYPVVEDLRERYAGEVTFVARYFPMPGHPNARNAAHAVEAAARQGRFEEMYQRMYETQPRWSHQQASQAPVFRAFASELGLDMAQYDADVDSPEVAARVQADVDDGLALGVQGTPTFFLGGQPYSPTSVEDFTQQLDRALAGDSQSE